MTTPETPAATTPEYLTKAEVAALFQVHPMTVARWGRTGKLATGFAPGGHRRYVAAEVHALLNSGRERGTAS